MRIRVLFAVLLVGVCAAVTAQVPTGGVLAQSARIGVGLDPSQGRIGIDVRVTDAAGQGVSGLGAKDFTLLDNGQPVKLVTFDAMTGETSTAYPPVQVILVLDDADLSPPNQREALATIDSYLRDHGGRLAHAVTVYRITSSGIYVEGPTADGNVLAGGLSHVAGMRDLGSLDNTIEALGGIAIEQRRTPGRKLLFWIGPGWRIDTKVKGDLFGTITELATRLRQARMQMFFATNWQSLHGKSLMGDDALGLAYSGVKTAANAKQGYPGVQEIAWQTGGASLTPLNGVGADLKLPHKDIVSLIEKQEQEANPSYRLTFDPPRTETVDEYHQLRVEVDRPGLTAHTTAGYYDEPDFYDQPVPGVVRVSVEQLEQRLEQKSSDRKLADELWGMELTERLTSARLERWLSSMSGEKSRQALTALADASAFLDPPASELVPRSAPDEAARPKIISQAVDYLNREIPRLPNFYATRTTTQYGPPLPKPGQTWKTAQSDQRMYLERTAEVHVFFKDGKEVVSRQVIRNKAKHAQDEMETIGTFGPILAMVLKGTTAAGSAITWSHWETSSIGPVAVFRYSAPDTRLYGVEFCCLALDEEDRPFHDNVSFHGEIAIEPQTGRIMRITVQADLAGRSPLKESGIAVEYGPVIMGGQTYICPLKSISIARNRQLWGLTEFGTSFRIYGPFKSLLGNTVFNQYHLFQSTTTILPGFTPVPENR